MISVNQVEEIHKVLIDAFGGVHGIRDLHGLESALARLFQTFDGEPLYSGVIRKAAALLQSFLINHPFIDGNKRTAYTITRILLVSNNLDIIASHDEKYNFVVDVASGVYNYDQIADWLTKNVQRI